MNLERYPHHKLPLVSASKESLTSLALSIGVPRNFDERADYARALPESEVARGIVKHVHEEFPDFKLAVVVGDVSDIWDAKFTLSHAATDNAEHPFIMPHMNDDGTGRLTGTQFEGGVIARGIEARAVNDFLRNAVIARETKEPDFCVRTTDGGLYVVGLGIHGSLAAKAEVRSRIHIPNQGQAKQMFAEQIIHHSALKVVADLNK